MSLPQDLKDLIIDYKSGLEHYERFRPCLDGVVSMYFTMKRMRMNMEFQMMFFPDWSAHIIPFPFPHLVLPFDIPDDQWSTMSLETDDEEPDP